MRHVPEFHRRWLRQNEWRRRRRGAVRDIRGQIGDHVTGDHVTTAAAAGGGGREDERAATLTALTARPSQRPRAEQTVDERVERAVGERQQLGGRQQARQTDTVVGEDANEADDEVRQPARHEADDH